MLLFYLIKVWIRFRCQIHSKSCKYAGSSRQNEAVRDQGLKASSAACFRIHLVWLRCWLAEHFRACTRSKSRDGRGFATRCRRGLTTTWARLQSGWNWVTSDVNACSTTRGNARIFRDLFKPFLFPIFSRHPFHSYVKNVKYAKIIICHETRLSIYLHFIVLL